MSASSTGPPPSSVPEPPAGAVSGPQAPSGETEAAPGKEPSPERGRRGIDSLFRILGFEPPGRWILLLSLFVLVDVIVLSWVQIQAYNAYYTFSQDFGSFNQSFYTAAYSHRLFYYTSNLPAGTHGTFFAVHFSPLLFLILPFYAIAAGPPTLLVIKATALALGAFPVFGLAHRRLGSPVWGFLFGATYLLSPLTMTLDWTSFDLEVFLPLFVVASFYFLYRNRTVPFLIFWTLSLATIETIAPLLAVFVTLALLGTFYGPKLLDPARRTRLRVLLLGTLVFTLVWYAAAGWAVSSINPAGGTYGTGYASHYTVLGANSFFDVVPQTLLHPNLAGAALSYAGGQKALYVLLLLGSLAFLPIFGEVRYSVPVAGWLVLALLSNFPPMYSFGSQYLGYVSPFLFAGAIGGVVYLRPFFVPSKAPASTGANAPSRDTRTARKWSLHADEAILPGTLIVALAVTVAVANPLLPNPAAGLSSLRYGIATSDAHTQLLSRIMGLIPNGAGVLTTPHLFPQLSSRVNAFVLPSTQIFAGSNTYWGSLDEFINRSTYVLLDFVIDTYDSQLIQGFGNLSGFGVRAAGDGIYLLERGWAGASEPGFWTTTTTDYAGASVAAGSSVVQLSNDSLEFKNYGKAGQTIWNGPKIARIDPGQYNVTVYYSLNAINPGPALDFQVTETPLEVIPVQYFNQSFGHHYEYVFQSSGPTYVATSVNIGPPTGREGYWTHSAVSLTVDVTSLANLGCLGVTDVSHFTLYVLTISVTPVSPPSEWGTSG